MAALTPKMATSVPISWMPASAAMTTIMTLELSEYSSQRMGWMPAARRRSYQPRSGQASRKWAMALMNRKSATAGPMGSSKSVRWAGTSVSVAVSKVR